MSEPVWKVHVWVCGEYSGAYEFSNRDDAIQDMEQRRNDFGVLGCRYVCTEETNSSPVNPEMGAGPQG